MRQAMNISRQPDCGQTVASDYLRLLATGAEARGVDMAPIWRDTQIDPAVLGVRGARLGWAVVERVWELVTARIGDPLFGLQLAAAIPFGAANLIDYLVLSSPDIGAALGKLARYSALINEADRMTVVARDDRASMRFQNQQQPLPPHRDGRGAVRTPRPRALRTFLVADPRLLRPRGAGADRQLRRGAEGPDVLRLPGHRGGVPARAAGAADGGRRRHPQRHPDRAGRGAAGGHQAAPGRSLVRGA